MKKKAIEKIPYQTAEKAKKKYTYVAAASIQEICGISHLFVEIYENKKESLLVPHIRMTFTKHDWAFYYPDDDWWRTSDISLLCIDQKKTYISEKAMDEIWNFVKERGWGKRNNNSWISTLNYLISGIKKERCEKQRQTRRERLNNRIANLPAEPADLKNGLTLDYSTMHIAYIISATAVMQTSIAHLAKRIARKQREGERASKHNSNLLFQLREKDSKESVLCVMRLGYIKQKEEKN